jgi:hypothetical protein
MKLAVNSKLGPAPHSRVRTLTWPSLEAAASAQRYRSKRRIMFVLKEMMHVAVQ